MFTCMQALASLMHICSCMHDCHHPSPITHCQPASVLRPPDAVTSMTSIGAATVLNDAVTPSPLNDFSANDDEKNADTVVVTPPPPPPQQQQQPPPPPQQHHDDDELMNTRHWCPSLWFGCHSARHVSTIDVCNSALSMVAVCLLGSGEVYLVQLDPYPQYTRKNLIWL